MDNTTLIRIGVVIVLLWIFWLAYLIYRKMKGPIMDGGDFNDYISR